MLKYYLKDGSREKGPFMLDDLKYQRIRPTTLVKIDSGEWKPVAETPDLSFLLKLDDHSHSSASYAKPDHHSFQRSAPELARKRARIAIAVAAMIALAIGMALVFYSIAPKVN